MCTSSLANRLDTDWGGESLAGDLDFDLRSDEDPELILLQNQVHPRVVAPSGLKVEAWKALISDPLVLEFVEFGVPLLFNIRGQPPVTVTPNYPMDTVQLDFVETHHQNLLEWGWVQGPLSREEARRTICSALGTVPKKDSSELRVILDTKFSVNFFLWKETFSLPTVEDAVKIIRQLGPHTHLAKVDLQHGYHQVPIRPGDTWMLGYQWGGQSFRYTRLPFGLNMAPLQFCKITSAIQQLFKDRGIPCLVYIDDFLILGESKEVCQRNLDLALQLFDALGVWVKHEKTVGPTQQLVFLGILIDVLSQTVSVPPDRLAELKLLVSDTLGRSGLSYKGFSKVLGKLSFAAQCVRASTAFLRRLFDALKGVEVPSRHRHWVSFDEGTRADLLWWDEFLSGWNGVAFWAYDKDDTECDFQPATDASSHGFGGHDSDGSFFLGEWSATQRNRSSTWREAMAVYLGAITWEDKWRNRRIHLLTDNMALVYILNSGSSRAPAIMKIIRRLFLLLARSNILLKASHLPREFNTQADWLSKLLIFVPRTATRLGTSHVGILQGSSVNQFQQDIQRRYPEILRIL
jgi:hypothetical protein